MFVKVHQKRDRPTDGQFLEAFLTRGEEAAFEALRRRHGPMVLGDCRRVLRNVHDADDAFQATFLVLARKAASVKPRELVGSWVYGVAYRTAMKARAMSAKRREKEKQAADKGIRVAELFAPLDESEAFYGREELRDDEELSPTQIFDFHVRSSRSFSGPGGS